MKVLDGQQLLDFMEIIEDRHGQRATIIISQLPVSNWYDVMKENTTAADAILTDLYMQVCVLNSQEVVCDKKDDQTTRLKKKIYNFTAT